MSLRIDYEPRLSDPYGYGAEAERWPTGPIFERCDPECECPECMPEIHDPSTAPPPAGRRVA